MKVVSSRRSTRPSRLGSGRLVRLELDAARPARRAAPRARSRSARAGPSPRSTRARPRPGGRRRGRRARASPSPFVVEHDRHAGREVRLADDQLPAPADLDDDACGESEAGAGNAVSLRSAGNGRTGPRACGDRCALFAKALQIRHRFSATMAAGTGWVGARPRCARAAAELTGARTDASRPARSVGVSDAAWAAAAA